MLIIALVLAVIGLAALVFAVVTSNELVAWACIVASVLGVVLLIVDALRERQGRETGPASTEPAPADAEPADSGTDEDFYEDYPEDAEDADDGTAAHLDEEPGVPADSSRGDDDTG